MAATTVASVTAGFAVTGCDLLSSDREQPPPADPLAPLLAGTLDLLNRYDAAIAAHPDLTPRLTPIRQTHQTHVAELAGLIGGATPGPGTAGPTDASTAGQLAAAALVALRDAELAGRRAAADACLSAPADRSILLGSIAAARASHAEVLR